MTETSATVENENFLDSVIKYCQEHGIPEDNDNEQFAAAAEIIGGVSANDVRDAIGNLVPPFTTAYRAAIRNANLTYNPGVTYSSLCGRFDAYRLTNSSGNYSFSYNEGHITRAITALTEEATRESARMAIIDAGSNDMLKQISVPDVDESEGKTVFVQLMSGRNTNSGYTRLSSITIGSSEYNTGRIRVLGTHVREAIAMGEQLSREGWTVIHANLTRHNGEPGWEEVPIAAVAPFDDESHWSGSRRRGFIMLLDLTPTAYAFAWAYEKLLDVFGLPAERIESTSDLYKKASGIVGGLKMAAQYRRIVDARIEEEERSIASFEQSMEQHRNDLALIARDVESRRTIVHGMKIAGNRHAFRSMRELAQLPEKIDAIRPIESVEVDTSSASPVITATTYPYVMKMTAREDNSCCEECTDAYDRCTNPDCECHPEVIRGYFDIAPIVISIDTAQRTFGNAVKLRDKDGNDIVHPHVSVNGCICWGDASGRISEAFAMRDWESMIRTILAWATRYSEDNGPYRMASELFDEYGESESSTHGWVIPES